MDPADAGDVDVDNRGDIEDTLEILLAPPSINLCRVTYVKQLESRVAEEYLKRHRVVCQHSMAIAPPLPTACLVEAN